MKYCVIGGAGFIGSHLVKKLLGLHHTKFVVIIDNLATGSTSNIEDIIDRNDVHMQDHITFDIIRSSDIIFHLAGSVGVKYIEDKPRASMVNNLQVVMNILDDMEYTQKLLVYTSTSEVYGDRNFKVNEDNNIVIGTPKYPRWGYASSKATCEFLISACTFPSIIIRPFNIIGPNQISDYGMVIPTFVEAALRNESIVIHNDGSQARCFCYVADFVDALLQVTLRKECHNQIYNIGNPSNFIRMRDLAKTIISLTNSESDILFTGDTRNVTDINYRMPDISKVMEATGWRPSWNLESSLKAIIEKKRELL